MSRYLAPKRCPICKTSFKPKRSEQSTCSPQCRSVARERSKRRKLKARERAEIRSSTANCGRPQGSADETSISETTNCGKAQVVLSPWQSAVKSPGPSVVARSVTQAKPLSDVERGALSLAAPGLTEELPQTGRADAVRNAVSLELGNSTFTDEECEPSSALDFPVDAETKVTRDGIKHTVPPLFGRAADYVPNTMPGIPAILQRKD